MEQKEKSKARKVFYSKFFLIFLLFSFFSLSFVYIRSFYQSYKIKQEISNLQKEIGVLENKKLESIELLSYVMDESFVEEKARTELNLKKEGENIIFFQDSVEFEKEKTEEVEKKQDLNNLIKWWYYFTNKSI